MSIITKIWKEKKIILNAFRNKYLKRNKNNILIQERISICERCPHSSLNKKKKNYNPGKYQNLPYDHCTICGCSLWLKVYDDWENFPNQENNPCPKQKLER